MRCAWMVAVSLSVLPGCLHSRTEKLPSGVLKDLTRAVIEERPEPAPLNSPYDVRGRGVAATPKEEQPDVPVGLVKYVEPPPVANPVSLERGSVPSSILPDYMPPVPPPSPGPSPPAPTTISPPAPKPQDPLSEALRYFRETRSAEWGTRLKGLEPERRELLTALLPLVAGLADQPEKGVRLVDYTPMLARLEDVIQAIRARSALSLDKVCFCRGIERFGVFDPLPADHVFQVGGEGQPGELVQLYAELKNFVCRRSEAAYETSLGCTLVLRDGKNRVVWRQDRPAQVERSRSPRRDCFLGCHFYVPPRLPVGDYYLTVQVSDLTGFNADEAPPNRTASRSLDFHVGGQGGR